MTDEQNTISSYEAAGVSYEPLDALKRFAQMAAVDTSVNLPEGMADVPASRGESARVIDIGPFYLAVVQEGLGTKNLIADEIGTGEHSLYDSLARDTVAMIVNDLVVVGARPLLVNAHWAFGSAQVLNNHPQKGKDLALGWAHACNEAGAMYAAGETPILHGIVYPETLELSGSAVGIIEPKERLTLGEKLTRGDHIVLVESSGIHANGLTLVRDVVSKLPYGYQTPLPDGRTIGEALMIPTRIYARFVDRLFSGSVDIHYMVHLTGHGWRKLMRAPGNFTYRMHELPTIPTELRFIQRVGNIPMEEMYKTFNMGAGFAVMVPPAEAPRVVGYAKEAGLAGWDAGVVEPGPRRVRIEPADIEFSGKTLSIR